MAGSAYSPPSTLARRPLRVAVVTPDLAGGGMTRAYWLAQALDASGHRVRVVGPTIQESVVYPGPLDGLEVEVIPAREPADLARAIVDGAQPELIYAVKPRRGSFGTALLAREACGAPVVLDVDDWDHGALDGFDSSFTTIAKRLVTSPLRTATAAARRLARAFDGNSRFQGRRIEAATGRADAITASSRFLAERYSATYAPSGKDTSLFDPGHFDPDESRERLGLSQFRVLMFPGTPQPHKGLEDLLRAMDVLRWDDLRLVLVGGRRTEFTRRLLDGWGRWIVELPRQPLAEVPAVVAAAHVVTVPQRNTAVARAQCPMKLTDGMAMAKPVLSTRVGDIPEILGDAGYLVEPSRPDELAGALRAIFAEPASPHLRMKLLPALPPELPQTR